MKVEFILCYSINACNRSNIDNGRPDSRPLIPLLEDFDKAIVESCQCKAIQVDQIKDGPFLKVGIFVQNINSCVIND